MMPAQRAINCQNGSTLMKTRPYWMTAITSAPAIVPQIVPDPPNRLAPPITTPAIETSSNGSPASPAPALKQPVYIAPPKPAQTAYRTYTLNVHPLTTT